MVELMGGMLEVREALRVVSTNLQAPLHAPVAANIDAALKVNSSYVVITVAHHVSYLWSGEDRRYYSRSSNVAQHRFLRCRPVAYPTRDGKFFSLFLFSMVTLFV